MDWGDFSATYFSIAEIYFSIIMFVEMQIVKFTFGNNLAFQWYTLYEYQQDYSASYSLFTKCNIYEYIHNQNLYWNSFAKEREMLFIPSVILVTVLLCIADVTI